MSLIPVGSCSAPRLLPPQPDKQPPSTVHGKQRGVLTDAPRALDLIDKATLEIKQDEDQTVYTDLQDIAEDLPDHSPRFVLLSYPLTLVRSFTPRPPSPPTACPRV